MAPSRYEYSVISFIDTPLDDIAPYICVPNSWMIITRRKSDGALLVAYPKERSSVTKERARRMQKPSKEWKYYTARLEYEPDSFDNGEIYIQFKTGNTAVPTNNKESLQKSPEKKTGNLMVAPVEGLKDLKLTTRRIDVKQPKPTSETKIENVKQIKQPPSSSQKTCTPVINKGSPSPQSDFMTKFMYLVNKHRMLFTNSVSLIQNMHDTIAGTVLTLDDISQYTTAASETYNTILQTETIGTNKYGEDDNVEDNVIDIISDDDIDNANDGHDDEKQTDSDDDWMAENDDDEKQTDSDEDYVGDNDEKQTDSDDCVDDDEDYNESETRNRQRNKLKIILPPEYDHKSSRWTLKYPTYKSGLTELYPGSDIYVDAKQLDKCIKSSKDCKELARMLLVEIFSKNALSVCTLFGSNVRPALDEHARQLLYKYVQDYGIKRGWSTDGLARTLTNIIYRFKLKSAKSQSVMLKCQENNDLNS